MRTSWARASAPSPPRSLPDPLVNARDALRRPRGLENRWTRTTDLHASAYRKSLASRALGPHPFPSRTRSLSQAAPMVLRSRDRGRVGRCRHLSKPPSPILTDPGGGGFCVSLPHVRSCDSARAKSRANVPTATECGSAGYDGGNSSRCSATNSSPISSTADNTIAMSPSVVR